ncbi:G patch domain-containing protein 4 [Colletes gigas]|uniref:G patch domain-containing protein 4 n=1 Tax=Colletes gigas TaxID=935657 RepID=UPI001C9B0792|nr:G patch domain-containing protein 4 [Colletes gigas]
MADFAKTQLMKYGWTEGKGLGKNESGITEALKPKLKFDTSGIGHKDEDWNEWWETGFNNAANNIVVKSQIRGVSISVSKKNMTGEHSKRDLDEMKCRYTKNYRNFLKTSTLLNGNLVNEDNSNMLEIENIKKDITHIPLTDEELFKVCGGRTAHKGARHGLTLNGKLKRIAQQEEDLLNINMSNKFERDTFIINNNEHTISPTTTLLPEEPSTSKVSKNTKRKNKRRINDLNHRLNILCTISDSDEKTKQNISDNVTVRKISKLKCTKVKKGSLISCDVESSNKEEGDKKTYIPFSVNQNLNEETTKNETQKQMNEQDVKEFDSESTHRKQRRKSRKKKEKDQDHEDGNIVNILTDLRLDDSQRKKFKKSHTKDSNIHSPIKDEDINMSDSKFQSESFPLLCEESPDAHSKKETNKLNSKISKRKKAKLKKKLRLKLYKITESLKAVNFNAEEPTKRNWIQ